MLRHNVKQNNLEINALFSLSQAGNMIIILA